MNYPPRILCKLMGALITGIVLVTPSCLPNPFDDSSFGGSGDAFGSASANTAMLEGIWDGTLDYPDYGYTSLMEVEFLSSGQALSFSQDGEDLFSVDPSATVQCDVSSSFAVNLNVQYSYYDDYSGEYVFCDVVMVGTMDSAGNYLSASGTQTFTTSAGVFVDIIYASSTKRSGSGSNNDSANTAMLEGIWDGTLDYPDYGYTSLTEVEFLSSGQALSFSQDGEDLFSVDPSATVQCDVSSSFAVNLNVQYSYHDDYSGEYVFCDVVMVGTMDPAGNYLSASGTQTITTSVGVFEDTIYASSTKRSGLIRGPGHNPWYRDAGSSTQQSEPGYPWYRDASFPTKGSAPGSIWRRNVMR